MTLAPGVRYEELHRSLEPNSPLRGGVVTIAPSARGTVKAVHGRDLSTAETVRDMARRSGALAAVNASFFDSRKGPGFSGFEGDPLGLYVSGGSVLSEAAQGRTALILPGDGGRARIDELTSTSVVTAADGTRRSLDGVNRVPGRIVGCGGVGGDVLAGSGRATTRPLQNQLCLDADEIVDFRPTWGATSPGGAAGTVEAVLDRAGRVTGLRSPAGGPIPAGGRTLSGMGEGAAWLRVHAREGETLRVTTVVKGSDGHRLRAAGASIVGAGPALLRDGRVHINAEVNGMSAAIFTRREPRTVAGVRADGTLLLVVFDGRAPGISAGVSLVEAARIMTELGAVDALNLDGGGSTSMVVDGELRNSPREAAGAPVGERKVATAIAVLPR